MKIARVFPRRTRATPVDALAFTDTPGLFPPEVEEVHVSVTFAWDLPRAEMLAREWAHVAPVKIGGPATGQRGEEFTPGMYLKPGYTITSRGCPNRCCFCEAWRRDGDTRELPIMPGHNVLDDNLMATSMAHFEAVIEMLRGQRDVQFTGGLEAARMTPRHAELIRSVHPTAIFMAYDNPEDWWPLVEATRMLKEAGMPLAGHRVRAYVLAGYKGDTTLAAVSRCERVLDLGVVPCMMVLRDARGGQTRGWREVQRVWSRPAISCGQCSAQAGSRSRAADERARWA